jgi:glyoxylase-like metal-dependent hydrolase (beta-lactamase superfamily II)
MRGIVEVADGVHQLTAQTGVNVVVLRDDDGITLVDTGLDRPGLTTRLAQLGIAPRDVTRILLTHAHHDHTGGVAHLRRAGCDAEVAIGEDEVAIAEGRADFPPAERRGARLISRLPMPGAWGRTVTLPQVTPLTDGQLLDVAGGLTVVATPGHTVGHVAFHLPGHDLVIGGDVVFNVFTLVPSPAFLCWRTAPNLASIARLAELGTERLALAHGRPVLDDAAGRLQTLVGAPPV